ncbi:MAG: hypothetical protein ACLGIZ_00050 [Acidimicrobiia bacterium]
MLTLILLVVLGGGAGLAAVWLVDARGLPGLVGWFEGRSLRRSSRPDTTPRRAEAPLPAASAQAEPMERFPVEEPSPTAEAAAVLTYEPVQTTAEPPPPTSSSGRRDGEQIPAAYTAIEGSYRDVTRVPAWRKLVSLATLLGILLVVGVTIAALAAATFGAIAELVDGAVG